MEFAVGLSRHFLLAAEMEIRRRRNTERPAAMMLLECLDGDRPFRFFPLSRLFEYLFNLFHNIDSLCLTRSRERVLAVVYLCGEIYATRGV